ncbi:hypothetical protein [Kitasatospora sp. NPDC094011]|uniref:hypothetical protein n=1 Tax=Kitasatospora sp. NPDC094011 TaxID=3364090 RepID=UPI0037F42857
MSSDEHLTTAQTAAETIARSVAELTGTPVTVAAVRPRDTRPLTEADAAFLGEPLRPDPHMTEITASFDIGEDRADLWADAAQPTDLLILNLANSLIDIGQEYTGSSPFPPCPGHQHPLVLGHRPGTVYWCCPHNRSQPLHPLYQAGS